MSFCPCDWQCYISQMLPHAWSAGGTAGTSGRDAGEVLCCTDTRSRVAASNLLGRKMSSCFSLIFLQNCISPWSRSLTAASCPAGTIAAVIGSWEELTALLELRSLLHSCMLPLCFVTSSSSLTVFLCLSSQWQSV